jgi:tetratricopeptide (TPR) repeat protein
MQYLDWITALLQKLEPKDILTLGISVFSLAIAGSAFIYTVVSKRRELAISVRNDLHDCILKLSENSRELGEDYHKVKHRRERTTLGEQRQLFLARAVYLIDKYRRRVDSTSQEFLLIGKTLADQGEFSGSLRFYKKSVRYALGGRNEATALRVYGRALIASGSAKVGRRKMLKSVAIFRKLSQRRGYDREQMICEMIDTYQRLISIEAQQKILQHAASDLAIAEQLLEQIQGKGRREWAGDVLKARESELAALGLPKCPSENILNPLNRL